MMWRLLGLLLLCGCVFPAPLAAPTPTMLHTDSGWQDAVPGVAWRELHFTVEAHPWPVMAFAVRLDPEAADFRVHYTPGAPRTAQQWAEHTGARFLINASFFTPQFEATGLLVRDGEAFGRSFEGYGGMFLVSGGQARVRSLARAPYRPGEPLDHAVQTFPMLLPPEGSAAAPTPGDRPNRRSIVGQDREGRLVFIVLPAGGLTLYDVHQWLARSGLFDLSTALNLDGGGSTMIYFNVGTTRRLYPSFDPVPAVIAAYLR